MPFVLCSSYRGSRAEKIQILSFSGEFRPILLVSPVGGQCWISLALVVALVCWCSGLFHVARLVPVRKPPPV